MPEVAVTNPPRLPLLLAAKQAVRLIGLVEDQLADDEERYGGILGMLRTAADELADAVALHETGLTALEQLREALLIALAD